MLFFSRCYSAAQIVRNQLLPVAVLSTSLLFIGCMPVSSSTAGYSYHPKFRAYTPAQYSVSGMTRANRRLVAFPVTIKGARSIRKFLTPGAEQTIVHILSDHERPGMAPEYRATLQAVQDEIHDVLTLLIETEGVKKLFVEGDRVGANSKRKMYAMLLTKEQLLKKYRYNAAERLNVEGKVKLLFLESTSMNVKANSILKKDEHWYCSKDNLRVVFEDREDWALSEMSRLGDPLTVFVYGGNHVFAGEHSFGDLYFQDRSGVSIKDNLHDWNRKHPWKKMSLIEVIVSSYPE